VLVCVTIKMASQQAELVVAAHYALFDFVLVDVLEDVRSVD